MTRVLLDEVSLDYPIFGARAYSLKTALTAAATGGRIGREAGVTVVQALRDISLDLREGDRLGIVGHNGAGKSTLLRVITGVYPPTRGDVRLVGNVASLIDPGLGIETEATGYENIRIRGLIAGMRLANIRKITPEIAEFSGLGDYLDMPVRTYSTGMVMRLSFSIATAIHADILVMDEWLSVGDAEFQAQAEERLRQVIDNTGILVLASHSPALIQRECNRRIELSHGVIIADDPVTDAPAAEHAVEH
jgi:lipopolysaccharide transport system ATP-binding protein